jgi:hypothetical protein
MFDRTQCALLKMTNLPDGAEPAWVYTAILYRNPTVQEIEMAPGAFYCYVDSTADAQSIAANCNRRVVLAEYAHTYKEIFVEVVPMTQAPATTGLCLSDFLRTEKDILKTKTVQFRGLPRGHPTRAVKEMSEKCFEYLENLDDEFSPTGYANTDTNPRIVSIDASNGNEVLVRYSSEHTAAEIVSNYNVSFWKNNVVYVECVADSEMEIQPKMSTGKQTKLFIPKVKPGASKEDIRAVFPPHECQDILMPPGKSFAFVFLYQEAATKFLNALEQPGGKRHNGWFWVIKTDQKKSRKNAAPATPDSKYEMTPVSGPLRKVEGAVDPTYGIGRLSVIGDDKGSAQKSSAFINTQETSQTYASGQTWAPQGAATRKPMNAADTKVSGKASVQSVQKTAAKIRVSGIPRAASEEQVRKFFEGYQVELNQGMAIVTMPDHQEAEEAQLVLNNNKLRKLFGKKVICVML